MARGRLAATVSRELRPFAVPSPFAAVVGTGRQVAWANAPVASVHRAAKAVGQHVTVNDAVLGPWPAAPTY